MQDLQDWISRYLLDCKYQKNLDPKTLKAYRIDLEQFSALISQNDLELTREGLMWYISNLHQRYKPRTVKRKIASVKAFCNYLEYEELVKENPFSRLRLKLNPPLILPRTISLPVIEAILAAAYQAREKVGMPVHIPDQTCQLHGEFPPGGRRKPATPPEGSASNGLCQP